MSTNRIERRLAVLFADMIDYRDTIEFHDSRSGFLKVGALPAAFRAMRSDLLDPSVDAHRGLIVEDRGDQALLAFFPYVIDAVHCGMAIQTGMATRDAGFKLRIVVNVCDVVIEGRKILGDGVIIALRLGSVIEPGEVAIPGAVHEDIAGHIDGTFRDSGQSNLKGIDGPINIWRWSP